MRSQGREDYRACTQLLSSEPWRQRASPKTRRDRIDVPTCGPGESHATRENSDQLLSTNTGRATKFRVGPRDAGRGDRA